MMKQLIMLCVLGLSLSFNIYSTDLCGPISGTLTITGSPYIVTCNVLVPDGETLTIDPGIEIRFETGHILQVDGTLIANGSAGNAITFTSNDISPTPGSWGKIFFSESENSILNYCIVEYAGSGGSNTGGIILALSNTTITNTTVRYTSSRGIFISSSAPTISSSSITENAGMGIECFNPFATPTIDNCLISNNGDYAISMYANNIYNIGSVTIAGNVKNSIRVDEGDVNTGTWSDHFVPYVIDGNITVSDGNTLTLNAGVSLRFDGDYIFEVNGSLIANGELGNEIRFISNQPNPSPGDWRQLYFNNSELSTLSYCEIAYGGSITAAINVVNSNPTINHIGIIYSAANGIALSNSSPEISNSGIYHSVENGIVASFDSKPIINSCNISDNFQYPISMFADNIKNIIGNTIIEDNGNNSIKVEGESVTTGVWLNHLVPYVIAGNISVADGETLTIDPGNELRFNSDYIFEVNGALVADGTDEQNIIFTSNKVNPNPGDWRNLSFFNSDPGTKLAYCQILYAGSNTAALNLTLSNFSIYNTSVGYSQQVGIYLNQSSPKIRFCALSQNLGDGIHIVSGQPDLGTVNDPGENTFNLNSGWDVYNNTPDTIYAQENYWFETDSAAIDANHIYDDDENASKGIVIFQPFLKTPPTDVEKTDGQIIPTEFVLEQNYPNPFNPSTNIQFSIPQYTSVNLAVSNILGERVCVLVSAELSAGSYNFYWNAEGLTSGIYFYRLQTGSFIETKKMLLLK